MSIRLCVCLSVCLLLLFLNTFTLTCTFHPIGNASLSYSCSQNNSNGPPVSAVFMESLGYYMCSSITKRASCFPASSRFRVRLISLRLGSCALNSNIRSNGRLAHTASNGERLPRRRPAHYTTAHRCGRFPYPIPPAKPFPIREGSTLQPGDTKHLGVLGGYTGLQRLGSWTTYFCTSTTEGISHSPLQAA
uniref:HDC03307 n=1 Tax=Drosophila melanogaster TaxID=7227 RepID=Q6IH54_DROME|nr:TPA_inf: HDC03307 [Drosophila melanogaster]